MLWNITFVLLTFLVPLLLTQNAWMDGVKEEITPAFYEKLLVDGLYLFWPLFPFFASFLVGTKPLFCAMHRQRRDRHLPWPIESK